MHKICALYAYTYIISSARIPRDFNLYHIFMSEIERYIEKKPSLTRMVVGFLLTPDGNVILGLRKKVSLNFGQNLITGIGGKVGDTEALASESDGEAMKREVEEEIGVRITNFHKVAEVTFLFPAKPKWDQFVVAYIIEDWEGIPEETDVISPYECEVDFLPFDRMWDDYHYWVPMVLEGKHIRATFLYGEDNSTVKEKVIEEVRFE